MLTFLLLGCCIMASLTQRRLGSAHMVPDDRLSTNRVAASSAVAPSLQVDPPPVVIVELNKSSKKKEKAKKQKKPKLRKRPPPPPSCVPLWGSCQAPGSVCCDFCAFCQCRLFRTVCLCRMGNPSC